MIHITKKLYTQHPILSIMERKKWREIIYGNRVEMLTA
jgi:hypothetical protein